MAARLLVPVRSSLRFTRGYAAQAMTEASIDAPKTDPKPASLGPVLNGKLSNGIPVIAQDNTALVGGITVAVRAGSRLETSENAGVSHYVRAMAFQSTKAKSALSITREAENKGIKLSADGNREMILYTVTFPKEHFNEAAALVADCVSTQVFHPWEVRQFDDIVEKHENEDEGLMEQLHRGAFRQVLGRPIHCPSSRIGEVTSQQMLSFVDKFYTGDRMAVAGFGVDHAQLLGAVKSLESLKAASERQASAKYYGGAEIRSDEGGQHVEAVLGYEGAAETDKDALAFDLLSVIISSPPSLKWATHSHARVNVAVKDIGIATGFSLQYSDAGVMGVRLFAPAKHAGNVILKASSTIKEVLNGNITEADLTRAKNSLGVRKLEFDAVSMLSNMAERAVLRAPYHAPVDYNIAIQAVTLADVKEAAKKALRSKPVYVVQGELDNVPYADQI